MYVCARYSHVCAHSTEHVVRGQPVDVGSLSHVGQEDRTQVVMPDGGRLDPLSRPTADLVFNAFWFGTGSLQYIAQGGLKLCLPSGITGMRYHARLLTGFCIA